MKEGFSGSRTIVLPKMAIDMMRKDPIMSQLHVTDIGYFPHAHQHYVKREQPIAQYILIYVMDGTGHYWYEDETGKKQEYQVAANHYFVIPAFAPHAYWTDEDSPWTIYWIHFEGALAKYYANGVSVPQLVKPELYSRISTRTDHFEEIFNVLNHGYTLESLAYASSLLNYYLSSLRYIKQYRSALQRQEGKEESFDIIEESIHYMKENIEKRLTLKDIADYTGYSASHFTAIFRQSTGNAPLAYFNILKMQYACNLLTNTNMQINQICHKIGFEDCYYFSRIFSKIVGVPPTKYRGSIQNNDIVHH